MTNIATATAPAALAEARLVPWTFTNPATGEEIVKPLMQHPDGIYVHLPQMDYLNDWALSYSAFKTLLSSPPDWHWESVFNMIEEKTRKQTPALRFGEAVHCALLERTEEDKGILPSVFFERFGTPPDAKSHPKALRTIPEIKGALESLGVKPVAKVWDEENQKDVAAKKEDWIDQLLQHNPKAQILDVMVEQWKADGFVELSQEQIDKLTLMVTLATKHPDLVSAFSGVGLSEVSVFWTDANDIRQRARFDRLKPNASIDLKTFANWQGRDFHKALLREAALRMYDLQAAHYDVARHEAKRLVEEGKVFFCREVLLTEAEIDAVVANEKLEERPLGLKRTVIEPATPEQMETVKAILCTDVWEWIWIFYKTDGAPTAQPIRFDRETKAFKRGMEFRDNALAHFIHYREIFGLQDMWLRLERMWTPDDEDWPFFMSADL